MISDNKTISAYRNLESGALAPAHQIGRDSQGHPLYAPVEGWEPVEPYELDHDGFWVAV